MTLDIASAILLLQPKAEFVIYNNDYSSIRWDSTDIAKPTEIEIANAIKNYKRPLSLEERIRVLELK